MNHPALAIGAAGPGFTLPGVDGADHSLEALKGEKGTLVVFTCNHCPYAIAYEDRLIALAQEYQSRGVAFLAISANNAETHPADSFENMKLRAEEKSLPYPYLYDESQQTAIAYGAAHTPEVYLLGADGKLAYHGRIDDNWQEPEKATTHELKDALEALANGQRPPKAKTFAIGCSIKWKPENR